MVFSRLFANESVLGVDIGSSSIKIVQAEPARHGAMITQVATCPTPLNAVKEGVILDVPAVAAAVQFAMRSAGIKASNGVAAIAGPGVIVRHVQLPVMSEKILRKSIRFEAGKYIASSIEDSIVEFEILGNIPDSDQMNVLLVAAPRAMIESRVSVLEQAGLEPLVIDVEVFATLRSIVKQSSDNTCPDSTIALLDIGASHTDINLISNGNLALTRTIPIAGTSFTNAIKNAENCSEEEAEQRKHALDLTELVDLPPGATGDQSLRAVQSLLDELLREIRRSINYYQSQLPDGAADTTVDRIILTGGTARFKGLIPYTASRLNVQVEIGGPVQSKEVSLTPDESGVEQGDIPVLNVAFGLAIREMSAAAKLAAAA